MTQTRWCFRKQNGLLNPDRDKALLSSTPSNWPRLSGVTGDGANRLAVSFLLSQSAIQTTDMALRPKLMIDGNTVGGLGKGPFQQTIDVRSQAAITDSSPAGMNPRRRSRIRGQLREAERSD